MFMLDQHGKEEEKEYMCVRMCARACVCVRVGGKEKYYFIFSQRTVV